MAFKDIYIQKKLPFGYWLLKYWPAEIMIQKGGDPVNLSWCENKKQIKWIKYFKAPWHKAAQCKQRLDNLGSWKKCPEIHSWEECKDFGMKLNFPVKYKMKYRDEIQEAWAEVKYDRCKLPHNWLRFAHALYPWRYSIDITFDREMGSERGSWKGGTVGCSAYVKSGETIKDALERRLAKQSFCRS